MSKEAKEIIRLVISLVFIVFCLIMFWRARTQGNTNDLIYWGVFYLSGVIWYFDGVES